ncbi:MAG: glycosyltransferase family 2 protein [Rudaea sp.]
MAGQPLVSIIISNYNYGRFLGPAIDSALAQTFQNLEVIVVDDGSSDNSRDIMRGYGERIIPIFKANGGQPSAFNAGVKASRGDIVMFLDADDMLLPETVQRVVDAFCRDWTLAKVQFRMQVIDAEGRPTAEIKPPRFLPLLSGDLRRHVLAFPDDLTWMATSGNAFNAAVLRRITPVPERRDGHGADWYLALVTPLFGPVLSFDWVGAYYRVHGSNFYDFSTVDLGRIRLAIDLMDQTHRYIAKYAGELGLAKPGSDLEEMRSVAFLGHRLVSYKLDPKNHPIPRESTWRLLRQGIGATRRRFDVSLGMKLMYSAWFTTMALAPRPVAFWLAERFFFPETRGELNTVLQILHRDHA